MKNSAANRNNFNRKFKKNEKIIENIIEYFRLDLLMNFNVKNRNTAEKTTRPKKDNTGLLKV